MQWSQNGDTPIIQCKQKPKLHSTLHTYVPTHRYFTLQEYQRTGLPTLYLPCKHMQGEGIAYISHSRKLPHIKIFAQVLNVSHHKLHPKQMADGQVGPVHKTKWSTTYYCFLLTGLATHHCRLPVYCLLTAAMVDANTIIDSKPSGVAIMQNVAGKLSQIAINPQNLQEFYPAIFFTISYNIYIITISYNIYDGNNGVT